MSPVTRRSDRAARTLAGHEPATGGVAGARTEWADTYAALTRADATSPLGSDDLELLATARTWLAGWPIASGLWSVRITSMP